MPSLNKPFTRYSKGLLDPNGIPYLLSDNVIDMAEGEPTGDWVNGIDFTGYNYSGLFYEDGLPKSLPAEYEENFGVDIIKDDKYWSHRLGFGSNITNKGWMPQTGKLSMLGGRDTVNSVAYPKAYFNLSQAGEIWVRFDELSYLAGSRLTLSLFFDTRDVISYDIHIDENFEMRGDSILLRVSWKNGILTISKYWVYNYGFSTSEIRENEGNSKTYRVNPSSSMVFTVFGSAPFMPFQYLCTMKWGWDCLIQPNMIASWALECATNNKLRGRNPSFPSKLLCVLQDIGISIIDITDGLYKVFMHIPQSKIAFFNDTPKTSLTFSGSKLYIGSNTPDNQDWNCGITVFDFARDEIVNFDTFSDFIHREIITRQMAKQYYEIGYGKRGRLFMPIPNPLGKQLNALWDGISTVPKPVFDSLASSRAIGDIDAKIINSKDILAFSMGQFGLVIGKND